MTEATVDESENPRFVGVEMVFDEQANRLDAALTYTEIDPDITLQTLNDQIRANNLGDFDFKPGAVENILRKVQEGTIGYFELATRKEYTDVEFTFDEQTNKLTAVLSITHTNPDISYSTLQDIVEAEGYDSFSFGPGALQKIAACAKKLEVGEFEVAERKIFGGITLDYNDETRQVMATIQPCYSDPAHSVESINKDIERGGYSEFYFDQDAIKNLLARAQKKESVTFKLGERKNAEITIEIPADKMQAFVTTSKACGGDPVTETRLNEEIRGHNILAKYCRKEVLQGVITEHNVSKLLFAEGIKPIDGKNTKFEPLVKEVNELIPSIDENTGKANFHEVNDFVIVDIDTPLMFKSARHQRNRWSNSAGRNSSGEARNRHGVQQGYRGSTN